jgi:hypothetical protein
MMKGKMELLTNLNLFFIPTMEMLHKEIQSLCNFSFLKIVKIEYANKVQGYFHEEMPSMPGNHHFSSLSLH